MACRLSWMESNGVTITMASDGGEAAPREHDIAQVSRSGVIMSDMCACVTARLSVKRLNFMKRCKFNILLLNFTVK